MTNTPPIPCKTPTYPLYRVFPEYYEVIKKPMDLHTAQEKIAAGEFETVESAVAALKLIWGNCRKFNAEGSEISGWADEMEAYMNDLVEVSVVVGVSV
jgi:hypothetical protein